MMHWGYMKDTKTHNKLHDVNDNFQLPKLPRVGKSIPSNLMINFNPRMVPSSKKNSQLEVLPYTQTTKDTWEVDGNSFKIDNLMQPDGVNEIVQDLIDGYNYNIMTYGQSKTGKTKLLFEDKTGLVMKICHDLYLQLSTIHDKSINGSKFNINLSMFEVYAESIFDLLVPVTSRKALKLQHQSANDNILNFDKNDYLIKNLKIITINDLTHLLEVISEITSTYHESRRSHVFMRLNIQQLDPVDDILKDNILQIIDYKDIDIKNCVINPEDLKKINLESVSFKTVVDKLSKKEKIHSHFKDSNFSRLLYSALMTNYKNLFILSCSNLKIDQRRTIELLQFAQSLSLLETEVYRNHIGLNSKAKYNLYVTDIKIKEENYKNQIGFLRKRLQSAIEAQPKFDEFDRTLNELKLENAKLKEQIKIVKLLNKNMPQSEMKTNPPMLDDVSSQKVDAKGKVLVVGGQGHDVDAMQIILEKCEEIAKLQLYLDKEKAINEEYKTQMTLLENKEVGLQKMNDKLLDQVNSQTKSLESVLSHNAILKNEVIYWNNIVENQKATLQIQEDKLKENNPALIDSNAISPVTNQEIGDIPQKMHSWSFSGTKASFWKTSKPASSNLNNIPQDPIVPLKNIPKIPEHVAEPRSMKRGLKLNSIRVVSNPISEHEERRNDKNCEN